ncbi:hypothetical protein ACMYR3_05740 [Ampullimonas aquatilis]|uniref:hypothetical protein n=1 Tax=Ampullimonas aquatilis TaxID=1341549 RepID=UPI003C759C33
MKNSILCLILLVASIYSQASFAISESNKTPVRVGVGQDNVFGSPGYQSFVQFAEALSTSCMWNVLYFDATTPIGKTMYATLITSRITGKKNGIAYTVISTPIGPNTCVLQGVDIQSSPQ